MSDDKIVELRKTPVQHDIVRGLRNLADRLEQEGPQGQDMTAVTTVMVLLGHSRDMPSNDGSEDIEHYVEHTLYSWGPRCDGLTTRGLLATALKRH